MFLLFALFNIRPVVAVDVSVIPHQQHGATLLQSWESALNTNTPVTRVVNLLKEMHETLAKEMEEDEELYHQLACWCNNNNYEKTEAIEEAEAKIAELKATIESLTAKSAELKAEIEELEKEVADNKAVLAEATAIREK